MALGRPLARSDHVALLSERAVILLLHPQGHAAVVKAMIPFSPDHNTIVFVFSLTSRTGIHHLDPADGACVALHVPAPHGHFFRECAPGVRGQDADLLVIFHIGHGRRASEVTLIPK